MLLRLRIPIDRFKALPRSVKTVCLFLPPAVSHLFFSLSSQPRLRDDTLSEFHLSFKLPVKEDSCLKVLVTELTNTNKSLSDLIESRKLAIKEREKRELCVLSLPEPEAASVLLRGIEKAAGCAFVIQKRNYRAVSAACKKTDTDSVTEESEMSIIAKKVLCNLSSVNEKAVAKALKRSDELGRLVVKNSDVIAKRFEWLQSKNFSRQDIIKFGGLLTVNPEQLESRLDIVRRKFEDFSTLRITAGILGVDSHLLDMYMRRWKSEAETCEMTSRVHWFSEKLEVSWQDMMDQMDTKPLLMTYSFNILRKKLLFLLDAGLKPKDLYDDLWVLARMEETLVERLRVLKESGIENIKPWHLRCAVKNLDRCTSASSSTAKAKRLYPDLRTYFQKKLQVDENCVEYMFATVPQLMQHSSFEKTEEVLNFLLEEGFSKEQIVTGPKVLTVGIETLKERLERIRELGFDVNDVPKSYFFADKYHFESSFERLQISAFNPTLKPRRSRRRLISNVE